MLGHGYTEAIMTEVRHLLRQMSRAGTVNVFALHQGPAAAATIMRRQEELIEVNVHYV